MALLSAADWRAHIQGTGLHGALFRAFEVANADAGLASDLFTAEDWRGNINGEHFHQALYRAFERLGVTPLFTAAEFRIHHDAGVLHQALFWAFEHAEPTGPTVSFNFLTRASILPSVGASVPTFSRATANTRTFRDWEGMVRMALANEAVFDGWRRVENLFTATATLATQGVTTKARPYVLSFSGTGSITYSGTASGTLNGQGANTRVSSAAITCTAGTLTCTVTGSVTSAQLEDVLDQANQNPSEYVSKGTLSSPFHGCNVDGVNYYNTQNGNTVAAEVVTEATGAAISGRGLSIWQKRTNRILQSQNFGITWVAGGTPTRTAAAKTCGEVVLDLIGDDDGAGIESYSQAFTFSISDAKIRPFSFFFSEDTSASTVVRIQDTVAVADRFLATITWSGGVPTVTPTTGAVDFVESFGNSVYRAHCRTTAVTIANSHTMFTYPATNAALDDTAATGRIYMGGMQAEDIWASTHQGTSPYIPTTTAVVTRNQDYYRETPITWFNTNPVEGTIVVEVIYDTTQQTEAQYHWMVGNGNNDRFLNPRRTDNEVTVNARVGNVEQVSPLSEDLPGGPTVRNTPYKIAFGFKLDDSGGSMNGNTAHTQANCDMPPASALDIIGFGQNPNTSGTTQLAGCVRKFDYYNRKLSTAELVSLSVV